MVARKIAVDIGKREEKVTETTQQRIVYIVTAAISADVLLRGMLKQLGQADFDVTLIASADDSYERIQQREQVAYIPVEMEREISPLRDFRSLVQLIFKLRQIKPNIVNAGTPKAGLLGTVAAFITRVPTRIYQQRGLRLETTSGIKRFFLASSERIACFCATDIVCNSNSLAEQLVKLRLASPKKVTVLGKGSSRGVDIEAFRQKTTSDKPAIQQLRQQYNIPNDSHVIGFIGRITRDKGIIELIQAFKAIQPTHPDTRLLLIGPLETGDPLPANIRTQIEQDPLIITTGFTQATASHYHLMDILAFPSYREGFPNVVLEASACGVPVIGFDTTGTRDAIINGKTGYLVPLGDTEQLTAKLKQLLSDQEQREQMGQAARIWITENFSFETVRENWLRFYSAI